MDAARAGGAGEEGWGRGEGEGLLRSMFPDWPENQSMEPSGSREEQRLEIEVFCLGELCGPAPAAQCQSHQLYLLHCRTLFKSTM